MIRAPWELRTLWNTVAFDPITATVMAISAGGTILGGITQASGEAQAGEAQQAALNYQATLAKQNANAVAATSQRQAVEERRKAAFTVSRARALAAASGAGADDPTVMNIEADIAGQGEYNALSRLYSGNAESQNLRAQAANTRLMGRQTRDAAYAKAGGTILSSITDVATMAAKYA